MSQGSLAKFKPRLSLNDEQIPHALSTAHFCAVRQFHCAVVAFVDISDTTNRRMNLSIVFGRGETELPYMHALYTNCIYAVAQQKAKHKVPQAMLSFWNVCICKSLLNPGDKGEKKA